MLHENHTDEASVQYKIALVSKCINELVANAILIKLLYSIAIRQVFCIVLYTENIY